MKLEELRRKLIEDMYLKTWTDPGTIWIWNEDGTVNVDGSVCTKMDDKFDKLPVKFKKVQGYFNCGYNDLLTLEGCPEVYGNFYCYCNLLTSLEFSPKIVTGDFSSFENKLKFSSMNVQKFCRVFGRIET